MPSPPLKQFCFCANLKTGGYVIAGLQIGYYVITLIGSITMLVIMQNLKDDVVRMAKEEGENHQEFEKVMNISSGLLWPVIIFRLIGIPISICLIIGTQKSNKNFILPYLIFEGIGMVLLTLSWFGSVPNNASGWDGLVFFIFLTVFLVLNKYFWICVLSLYLLIQNEERGAANNGAMIPLQTIPENAKVFMPANNAYPPQQQPLYVPPPTAAYPQQGQKPPAYPVQVYHSSEDA